MERRVLQGIRRNGGRNPRGYGLSSLVVVLFFVSVIVQSIISVMARETTEAKAEAAFNITKEHLDTFKITGARPSAEDMPHIAGGQRYVTSSYIGTTANPRVAFAFTDRDARARELFNQKLRAYTNIPSSRPLVALSSDDIRRAHPERTLRAGDRMATPIETQNIVGANTVRLGTGTSDDVRTVTLQGTNSTLLETPNFLGNRIAASKIEATNDLVAQNMDIAASLVHGEIIDDTTIPNVVSGLFNVSGLSVVGHMSADDGTIQTVAQSGRLVPADNMSNVADLSFEELNASGLRVKDLYSDQFQAGEIHSGSAEGVQIGLDNSPYSECREAGGSFFDCVSRDDDVGSGEYATYDECIAAGSDATTCADLPGAPGNPQDPGDGSDPGTGGGQSGVNPFANCIERKQDLFACLEAYDQTTFPEPTPYQACLDLYGPNGPIYGFIPCSFFILPGENRDGSGFPKPVAAKTVSNDPFEQCMAEIGDFHTCQDQHDLSLGETPYSFCIEQLQDPLECARYDTTRINQIDTQPQSSSSAYSQCLEVGGNAYACL